MAAFKDVLHRLRKQYLGKQFTLAATLGCTEAAVSYWEHGRRRPHRKLMPSLLACFRASGAQEPEIMELHDSYDGDCKYALRHHANQPARAHRGGSNLSRRRPVMSSSFVPLNKRGAKPNRDWEATFMSWGAAPGTTEMTKCDNAERAVRKAISASAKLSGKNIKVFTQGSYAHRTNVRQGSDVDICVMYQDAWFPITP